MERAVLLIGVAHAAAMPELPAVGRGIEAMQEWARGQKLPRDRVTTLTDTDDRRRVAFTDVSQAIEDFARLRTIEQLIVHFCGHGLVIDGSEVWLLSDATRYANEAVNVAKSKLHAESGAFPHVVLISDACRTAPSDLAYASITGNSVFRIAFGGPRRFVDQLFATRRGAPALQVATSTGVKPDYAAVYTEVLAEALKGDYPEVLESVDDDLGAARLVRLGPLYKALPCLVAARLTLLKSTAFQHPDGAVLWDTGQNWVSRLPPLSPDGGPNKSSVREEPLPAGWEPPPDPVVTLAQAAAQRLMVIPPPDGTSPVRVFGMGVEEFELLPRAFDRGEPGRFAMVRLEGGRTAVVPVFHGGVTTAVFEDDQLVDLRFTDRGDTSFLSWERAWMSAGSRWLLPWWGDDTVEQMMVRCAGMAEVDPASGVLLAHALVERGRQDLVRELLTDRSLPDVALLAGQDSWEARGVAPPRGLPLYSRTWSLLGDGGLARRPEVPLRVASPWTLFAERIAPSNLSPGLPTRL